MENVAWVIYVADQTMITYKFVGSGLHIEFYVQISPLTQLPPYIYLYIYILWIHFTIYYVYIYIYIHIRDITITKPLDSGDPDGVLDGDPKTPTGGAWGARSTVNSFVK